MCKKFWGEDLSHVAPCFLVHQFGHIRWRTVEIDRGIVFDQHEKKFFFVRPAVGTASPWWSTTWLSEITSSVTFKTRTDAAVFHAWTRHSFTERSFFSAPRWRLYTTRPTGWYWRRKSCSTGWRARNPNSSKPTYSPKYWQFPSEPPTLFALFSIRLFARRITVRDFSLSQCRLVNRLNHKRDLDGLSN